MPQQLSLHRDDILLRLPAETEQLTRTQPSGLEVSTLQSQTYNPVYGTVITMYDKSATDCQLPTVDCRLGDLAFFQIFTFSTAKDRAYGDLTNPQFANEHLPVTHYAFIYEGIWYMIIRASSLYFIKRPVTLSVAEGSDEQIVVLNNYVIASPVPAPSAFDGAKVNALVEDEVGTTVQMDFQKKITKPWALGNLKFTPPSGIKIDADELSKFYSPEKVLEIFNQTGTLLWRDPSTDKGYQLNQAIIQHTSVPWLSPGDHVLTLRYCDITIEEEFNFPLLPKQSFIIESQNIVAIMNNKTYRAGPKRVIVKPDEIITQTSSGLIDHSAERAKLLTGVVISVGENCSTWKENSTVLYARNSGMPIPTDDGDLLVLADIDIFAVIEEINS